VKLNGHAGLLIGVRRRGIPKCISLTGILFVSRRIWWNWIKASGFYE